MRLKHLPIAALAALSLVAGTVAAPTVADAQNRDRQIHGDRDGDRTVRVNRDRDRRVTTRHVVRRDVRHRFVHRHHHRDRFVVRSTAISVPFVVLGAPVVYRAYGAGWCRALHRGRHWSPGIGWHAGQHVGRVRC